MELDITEVLKVIDPGLLDEPMKIDRMIHEFQVIVKDLCIRFTGQGGQFVFQNLRVGRVLWTVLGEKL